MAAKVKKDLSAFRAAHDRSVIVPQKINAALADLAAKEGPEGWEYEGEFMKRANISQTDIGAFRDQFEKHIVETKGQRAKRVWFANPIHAAAARKAIG
jgi:hypothetical protein